MHRTLPPLLSLRIDLPTRMVPGPPSEISWKACSAASPHQRGGGAGRIIDLLADRSGQVRAAVIEFGGFLGIGTRKIAVDWSALRFEGDGKQPP